MTANEKKCDFCGIEPAVYFYAEAGKNGCAACVKKNARAGKVLAIVFGVITTGVAVPILVFMNEYASAWAKAGVVLAICLSYYGAFAIYSANVKRVKEAERNVPR